MQTTPPSPSRPARRPQHGAVAVLTAILIALLVGFAALVVDLGRLYVFKTELQTAMDACALAASGALTGTSDPNLFEVAKARGLSMLDATKRNAEGQPREASLLHFQSDALDLGQVRVEFSESMQGPWSGSGTPSNTKYVRCSYADPDNPVLLGQVLNVFDKTGDTPIEATAQVGAYAVATLSPSQTTCAIPVGLCKAAGQGAATEFGLVRGKRYIAQNDKLGTGHFGWIDFTPPNGGSPELAELLEGEGNCDLSIGTPAEAQGTTTSLDRAWNSRFGIYPKNLVTPGNPPPYPPDYSGHGYGDPGSSNHYADYMTQQVANRTPFQGAVGNNEAKLSDTQHAQYGRSRRIVAVPVIDCSQFESGGSAAPVVEGFACALMLAPIVQNAQTIPEGAAQDGNAAIEYLGLANDPASPCASGGMPGGSTGPLVPTLVQ